MAPSPAPVAYVDHAPIPSVSAHYLAPHDHVHVRTSGRCVRNRDGELCENDPATLRAQVEAALEAIRLTQEYVQLPCVDGWSWWDFYRTHRPEDAERLRREWERHAALAGPVAEAGAR